MCNNNKHLCVIGSSGFQKAVSVWWETKSKKPIELYKMEKPIELYNKHPACVAWQNVGGKERGKDQKDENNPYVRCFHQNQPYWPLKIN